MLSNQRWHEATELVKDLPKEPGRATVSWAQQDEPKGQLALPLGDSYNGIPQNLGLSPLRAGSQLAEDER